MVKRSLRAGKMPDTIRDQQGNVFKPVLVDRKICEFKAVLVSQYSGCTFVPGRYERCKQCPASEAHP